MRAGRAVCQSWLQPRVVYQIISFPCWLGRCWASVTIASAIDRLLLLCAMYNSISLQAAAAAVRVRRSSCCTLCASACCDYCSCSRLLLPASSCVLYV